MGSLSTGPKSAPDVISKQLMIGPTMSFPSVREEDFGHYQCEVKDAAAGKVLLTVYRALYKKENGKQLIFYCMYIAVVHEA